MSHSFRPTTQPSSDKSGVRRCSKLTYAGLLSVALLAPMVATPAYAQSDTTTTVAAAATDTSVATDATTDTTVVDEPVGGVDAGFGGSVDQDHSNTAPLLAVAVGAVGAAGAGFWLMRRRSTGRSIR